MSKSTKAKKEDTNEVVKEKGMRISPITNEIDWDWYTGADLVYPKKDNYVRYWIYKEGQVILDKGTREEYENKIEELAKDRGNNPNMNKHDNGYWKRQSDIAYVEKLNYVKQYTVSEEYKIEADKYNKEMNNRHSAFKKDMLEYYGLTGHPKAEKAWEMAWNKGHAYGLHEVFIVMGDIADLVI